MKKFAKGNGGELFQSAKTFLTPVEAGSPPLGTFPIPIRKEFQRCPRVNNVYNETDYNLDRVRSPGLESF